MITEEKGALPKVRTSILQRSYGITTVIILHIRTVGYAICDPKSTVQTGRVANSREGHQQTRFNF